MGETTLALVGATGGAGTTRTAVELAAVGADDGRDVAVLDAAYATQGLSEYVHERISPDLTRLVTDETDAPLAAGAHEFPVPGPGRVDLLPVRAPFERLARAKTAAAARALEARIDEAAAGYDHVVVDTPPVAANQALAAVSGADRVAAVTPATRHGRDALQRLYGRLDDVGTTVDVAIATRGSVPPTDVDVPATDAAVAAAPTGVADDGAFGEAVATAFEAGFAVDLDVAFENGSVFDRVR